MKKVLKYFTDEALTFIKSNQEEFISKIKENPNSIDWLNDFCGITAMVPSKYEFDFEFKKFTKKEGIGDYENAIALYNLFKENNIGPAMIYNEKFISGFIFTFGYEYFIEQAGAEHAFSMLFFENDIHRSVVRNLVARLYRFVELTIDENNEDKYWLTKFAFNNMPIFRFAFNTSTDGKNTHMSYIKACKIWIDKGNKINDDLKKHLSMLVNVSDTDIMSEKEIVDYLIEYLEKANENKKNKKNKQNN